MAPLPLPRPAKLYLMFDEFSANPRAFACEARHARANHGSTRQTFFTWQSGQAMAPVVGATAVAGGKNRKSGAHSAADSAPESKSRSESCKSALASPSRRKSYAFVESSCVACLSPILVNAFSWSRTPSLSTPDICSVAVPLLHRVLWS